MPLFWGTNYEGSVSNINAIFSTIEDIENDFLANKLY